VAQTTPTPTPTVSATPYPATITSLRVLLTTLYQQDKVDVSAYTALKAHLDSAERQLQRDHDVPTTVAILNSFIKVVQARAIMVRLQR
jgi:hypothetical protein